MNIPEKIKAQMRRVVVDFTKSYEKIEKNNPNLESHVEQFFYKYDDDSYVLMLGKNYPWDESECLIDEGSLVHIHKGKPVGSMDEVSDIINYLAGRKIAE